MKIACVFPGQGSQFIGMGHRLAKQYSAARHVFEKVDETLGEALSTMIWEGEGETLRQTRFAQPALLAMSVAVVKAIEQVSGRSLEDWASCVAGHSLGEYSALVCAGALKLEDATKLVRIRADAMQEAVPDGKGAMMALLGGTLSSIESVLEGIDRSYGVCSIANDNAPGQVVISGERMAVENASRLCQEKAGVRRAIPLSVSAPFHCSLMLPAVAPVLEGLKAIAIKSPKVPYIPNVTGTIADVNASVVDLLGEQITQRVRWCSTLLTMEKQGIQTVVECGAGSVLSGLVKRTIPQISKTLNVSTDEHVGSFCAIIEEHFH